MRHQQPNLLLSFPAIPDRISPKNTYGDGLEMNKIALFFLLACTCKLVYADECTGSDDYSVCTRTSQAENGDTTISSYDTEGNNYSVTSGSRSHADGSTEVFSTDSEGNQYSVKSWCDSSGCHSTDSDGNMCTITNAGEAIGC